MCCQQRCYTIFMKYKNASIRQLPDESDRYINILAKNIDGRRADAIVMLIELTEYVKSNEPSIYENTLNKYLDKSYDNKTKKPKALS